MIKLAEVGDVFNNIEKYEIDGIMNAANGIGPMGRGIAGAIRKHGGNVIQKEAFLRCIEQDPREGDSYVTGSGSLSQKGIKSIIHAVTMKEPGGPTSYEIVGNAFKSALDSAVRYNIKKIGCTALGTGVGNLNSSMVGTIMHGIAEHYWKDMIEIYFFDFDTKFIDSINRNMQ
jgi:O-acetyl-ADP-ribose deacetylase